MINEKHRANIALVLEWLNKEIPDIYAAGQSEKGDALYARNLGREVEDHICKMAILFKTRRWQDGQIRKMIDHVITDKGSTLSESAKDMLAEVKRLLK